MASRQHSNTPSAVHIGVEKLTGKDEKPTQPKGWFRRQLGAIFAWATPQQVPVM